MARLPLAANTEGNDQGLEDFRPLPSDDYFAIIEKSSWKETKAKNGNYLQLIWKIIDGEFKGRTLFDNLNLDNPNPIAVEIANKSLNSICKACEKVGVEDSEELHGIPVKLSVILKPATETNPASNNIKAYEPAGTPAQAPSGEATSQGTTSPEAGVATAGNSAPAPVKDGQKLPWE